MKVLVTGGAGYVGSVVSRCLLSSGHEVKVFDSLRYGGHGLVGLYPEDRFTFVRGDVRSAGQIKEALTGMDAVVHMAAIVGDSACDRDPALALEVNREASLQLYQLSRLGAVERFVFASTCSNYGKTSSSDYLTEDSALHPVSLYAETKVAVEKALLNEPAGPGVTLLRLATVFGLSPRMRFDLTVNEFTMHLATKRKLVVFGEQFWRPYVHVRDVARTILLVLEAAPEKVAGCVFNVGDSAQNYQKRQLVELVCAQVGGEAEIEYVHREADPRDYRVSCERLKAELGFHITRTVSDGIREIADAIRQRVISDVDDPRYRD